MLYTYIPCYIYVCVCGLCESGDPRNYDYPMMRGPSLQAWVTRCLLGISMWPTLGRFKLSVFPLELIFFSPNLDFSWAPHLSRWLLPSPNRLAQNGRHSSPFLLHHTSHNNRVWNCH